MPTSPAPPKTLSEALVALQAQLPRIPKTDEAQVGTRTYRYANLATITDLLMPILSALGLAWICKPTYTDDGRFVLAYELRYNDGNGLSGEYPLPSTGTPQQIGSAITYARRYALTAVTGIAPADDDDDAAAAETAARESGPARLPRTGTDASLREQGRMDRKQKSAHERLAAETVSPDDPWTDQPAGDWQPVAAEDKPGSSNGRQHQRLGILYQAAGITDRDDRLADATNRVGRAITSSKDLSYVEAEQVMAELEKLAKERGQ